MKAQLCLLEERVAAAPFGENMRCQACRNTDTTASPPFSPAHIHAAMTTLLGLACTPDSSPYFACKAAPFVAQRDTHTCQPFCALVLYLTKTLRRGGAFTSHNTPATQIDRKRTILERGLVNGSLQGPTWSLSQYHFFYGCVKTCKI